MKSRGVTTAGVDVGIYTPPPKKISPSKHCYGVKLTPERLFNSFIPPKKLIPPKQISGYAPDEEKT